MKFNWNPMYSPVWRWLGANSLAVLAAVAAAPDVFGQYAHVAQVVAGTLTALGFGLGANLKKPE